MIKKSLIALTGITLGILANSYDVHTSPYFRFNNPVSINSTLEEQFDIVSKRPFMRDTQHSLKFFEYRIPLITNREVIDPVTGKSYQGLMNTNEDIHTKEGVYQLNHAHDSQWYEKDNPNKDSA